jgi:DNA-binding NarL/FixJ family response regulator
MIVMKPGRHLISPKGLNAFAFEFAGSEYVLFAFPTHRVPIPAGLTPAESAVVCCLFEGMSNAEIARARGSSIRTVANQLRSISRKLRVSTRAEVVAECKRRAQQPRCIAPR